MVVNTANVAVRKVVDCCSRCCWMVLCMPSCNGLFLYPILSLPVCIDTRGVYGRIGARRRLYLQFVASALLSYPKLSALPSGFAVVAARIHTDRQRLVVAGCLLYQIRTCWFQAGCFISIFFVATG